MRRILAFGLLACAAAHAQTPPVTRATDAPLSAVTRTADGVTHLDDALAAGPLPLAVGATAPLTLIAPGQPPEGDNAVEVRYTPAGDRVVVLARHSRTLHILDASTLETLDVVDLPSPAPRALGVTDTEAIVAYDATQTASIVDLETLAIRTVTGLGQQPARIVMSPDLATAYISYASYGPCYFVDLASGTVRGGAGLVATYFVNIYFGARERRAPSDFVVTPDGSALLGYAGLSTGLRFFNAQTGASEPVAVENRSFRAIVVTPDGKKAVFFDPLSGHAIYRLDLETRTVDGVVELGTEGVTYGIGAVPDAEGNRVAFGYLSFGSGGFEHAVADFSAGTVTTLGPTDLFLDWRGGTPDGRYVVAGGPHPMIYDFETSSVRTFEAPYRYPIAGAVSPLGTTFVMATLPTAERLLLYGIDGTLLADRELGAPPEADGPSMAAHLPDGRLLVANAVSSDLAIYRPETGVTEATLPLPRNPGALAVSPTGSLAFVVTAYDSTQTLMAVDLTSGDVLSEVPIAGSFIYAPLRVVYGGGTSVFVVVQEETATVRRFRWDGTTLSPDAPFPFTATDVAVAPDLSSLLVLDADHLEAVLVDPETGTELHRAPAGGAPSAVVYAPDGTHAAVVGGGGPSLTLLSIAGGLITGHVTTTTVPYAARVAYSPDGSLVAVGSYDPVELNGPWRYAVYDAMTAAPLQERMLPYKVLSLAIDDDTSVVALTGQLVPFANGMFYALSDDGVTTPLPGEPGPLLTLADGRLFFPVKGPDFYAFYDGTLTATEAPAPTSGFWLESPAPNPTSGSVRASFTHPTTMPTAVEVFDLVGRRVRRFTLEAGARHLDWDATDGNGRRVPPGVYVLRASDGARTATARVTIVR